MTRIQKTHLKVSAVKLDEVEQRILADLAQECRDYHGRAVSAGAIMRALIRLAKRGAVERSAVLRETEAELLSGRRWGTVVGERVRKGGRRHKSD
ncbi:MAG TPA: hypothetical protein VKK81_12020 [Candidatus Binatia bacterium]|nr:hypothetical protein [Candidatus Binatia bacterium]